MATGQINKYITIPQHNMYILYTSLHKTHRIVFGHVSGFNYGPDTRWSHGVFENCDAVTLLWNVEVDVHLRKRVGAFLPKFV